MFDFSFTEMLLSGVVALVVLGPERLPKVARKAGEWVGKIQRLAAGVKQELAANGEYAELSKVKQDFTSTVADLKQELHDFGKQVEQETQTIAQHTQELAQQNCAQIAPTDGGVSARGSLEHVYRINFYSRTASRVLLQLAQAP